MLLALMKKELLALSRDIHGMGALFIMPMVFIIVMSMALKDVYTPATKRLAYAVVNQDQGNTADKLIERWAEEAGVAQPLPAQWQDEVRAGRLKYVLLVEAGFSKVMDNLASQGDAKARLLTEPGLDNSVFTTNRMRLLAIAAQLRVEGLLAK